jgi:hypothetical protein
MNDEYVRVTFSITCPVLMGNPPRPAGFTNEPFQVETGTHVFRLDSPQDYTPKEQELLVKNTLPSDPLVIVFEPVPAGPGEG